MNLYNYILILDKKNIFKTLVSVGAIPFRISQDFELYKQVLKERRVEPRKTQSNFNVAENNKTTSMSVYRAIKSMEQEVKGDLGEMMLNEFNKNVLND